MIAYDAPMQHRSIVIRAILALALAAAACGGKKQDAKQDPPAAANGDKPPGSAPSAGSELATAADPPGVEWKAVEQPFGTVELPVGPWELSDNQLDGKDGTVVMLQSQDGITPDQLDEYLASYEDVQRRDAPKYAGKASTKGLVGGARAVRVEGTFDNGTRFVTRDYLIFTERRVLALSARTPEANAANLPGVIDHIARTARSK